jgi:hypothetical protein
MHGQENQKGCWFIKTAGRWPWKSESAKECVTTHLPNGLAPKMDGVIPCYLCLAVGANYAPTSRWAHRLRRSAGVNRHGAADGADLGGSSNYSNKNFED